MPTNVTGRGSILFCLYMPILSFLICTYWYKKYTCLLKFFGVGREVNSKYLVFVDFQCSTQVPSIGRLISREIYRLQFWMLRSPRLGKKHGWILVNVFLLVIDYQHCDISLKSRAGKRVTLDFFGRAPISVMKVQTLCYKYSSMSHF